ncbi:MAG TPA: phospholipase D-like domain-containing protein, partial [Planctomycetota bacterium]|nr:phospholipase D-like domain-containing protein [Planctomycetota bacterium]
MTIPFVIDNQTHRLSDVLNSLLAEHRGKSLDVATAYFTVSGFALVKDGMASLGNFRLLLGAEPESGEQLGLRPKPEVVLPARRSYGGGAKGLLRGDLERLQFSEATLRLVEDLIAFLRRDSVRVRLYENGFLHAKCYLFYADRPGAAGAFDRFCPILAIVGSSNFTGPAFTTNRELNLVHTAILDPGQVDDPRARDAVRSLYDQLERESVVGADGVRPRAHAVCPYIAPDEDVGADGVRPGQPLGAAPTQEGGQLRTRRPPPAPTEEAGLQGSQA